MRMIIIIQTHYYSVVYLKTCVIIIIIIIYIMHIIQYTRSNNKNEKTPFSKTIKNSGCTIKRFLL